MNSKKTLNDRIDAHLIANPKAPGEIGYYQKIGLLFNAHPEKIRKRWRNLQTSDTSQDINYMQVSNVIDAPVASYTVYDGVKDTTTLTINTNEDVRSLDDLIRVASIDTRKFEVLRYSVKSAELKDRVSFTVNATMKAKTVDNNAKEQAQYILDLVRKESKAFKPAVTSSDLASFVKIDVSQRYVRDCALEINIPDLHIGKLAWGKESGEDYNIEEAVLRYKNAVKSLLSRVNPYSLEKFILPVGNDMINIDNKTNTTTQGTPQSCDSRFGKMFQTAKELLIDTIDELSQFAPVEVVVVPGNHDTVAMFTLGEVLDAWYHNNDQVTIKNTHTPRKYLQYGKNLLMYVHGHNEKLQELGIICATEQPELWAATKFRRVHVGHFHHSKQIKYVDIQEYPGFTVKILNSLSANDAWHCEKGYMSLKGAEAFLYHKDNGLLANYYYMNQ